MTTPRTTRDRIVATLAVVMYLAVGVMPYLGSTIVVPVGAAVVLWAAWLVGLAITVRLVGTRSRWALASAPTALGVWVLYVSLGSILFGWTA